MNILKKSTRLHQAVMMIKYHKLMMELQHIFMDTRAGKVCKTEILNKVNINELF